MDRKTGSRGFTLIEVAVCVALLGIIITSVLSIALETYAFAGDNEADLSVQAEANQAFERMTEVLRKCGWSTLAGISYPRVWAGGAELEFRVLRDLDGNGYPFSAATGELEYSPAVYRMAVDPNGNFRVYSGGQPVWHLCRGVRSVSFATYLQDNTLQMREIRINLQTRKMSRRGDPIDFSLSGCIDMRN